MAAGDGRVPGLADRVDARGDVGQASALRGRGVVVLQTCLRAIHVGFAAEGLVLTMPSDPAAVTALGPRLTPDILDRLRLIACPNSAAALMLALATDAGVRSAAGCATSWILIGRGLDGPFAADFTRHTSLTAAEPNQTVLTGRRTLVAAFTDAGRY